MDPLWTHSYRCIHIYGPTVNPFIYVYSYMDPLWTHYGPIHVRVFIYIYGPIMDLILDPFIYLYSYMDPLSTHYGPIHTSLFLYMDPLWTHSHTCIHKWNHYGPIMYPLWIHSYTCVHIWTHYGPIMEPFIQVSSYIWTHY